MLNRFLLLNNALDPRPMLVSGPVLQAEVAVPTALARSLTTSGQPIPQPQMVQALVDTGASGTCVDLDIVAALGLQPVGQASIATPSATSAPMNVYAVRLTFPQQGVMAQADPVHAMGCPLKNQGIGVLLGRDFLLGAVLVYNGPGGFFTLAF